MQVTKEKRRFAQGSEERGTCRKGGMDGGSKARRDEARLTERVDLRGGGGR